MTREITSEPSTFDIEDDTEEDVLPVTYNNVII